MQTECGKPDNPNGLVIAGPTVLVQIAFDPKYKSGTSRPPGSSGEHFHALVDTGATMSCIDSGVAGRLMLPTVEHANVAGALGPGEVNVYLAQVHIPALKWTVHGRFFGVHLHEGGQQHDALLGRDLLKHTHMVYDGKTGSVIITRPDGS